MQYYGTIISYLDLTVWESWPYAGSAKYVNEVPVSTRALKSALVVVFPTPIPIMLMLYVGLTKRHIKELTEIQAQSIWESSRKNWLNYNADGISPKN